MEKCVRSRNRVPRVRSGALFVALLSATGAQAAPAWEVAESWRCYITSTTECAPNRACTQEKAEIIRDIDFGKGEVWLVGLDPPHERFSSTPLTSRDYDGGGSYVSTDRQLFLLLPQAAGGEHDGKFSLQVAALSVTGNSMLMYGSCKPLGRSTR